ncbi:MAG: alpha/beta hydrolase [Ktedonobacteraceae bacterium]
MFDTFERTQVPVNGATIHLVKGGQGYPLLLLHGYPQTHTMWHNIAPRLTQEFTVIAPDLRGYGDSSKPKDESDHASYSKRAMAQDLIEVMGTFGYEEFFVVGHDRGGRVGHRLALDHPQRVKKLAVLDIAPTYKMYMTTDKAFATAYYHWFFLIQPYDLPERLISAQPEYYLRRCLTNWSADATAFAPEAVTEYLRCFSDPATIHATCEDYRASATIDLLHDEADLSQKVTCPLLALWSEKGVVGRTYNVLDAWRERAINVHGQALPGGHFLPEEAPNETYDALRAFLV